MLIGRLAVSPGTLMPRTDVGATHALTARFYLTSDELVAIPIHRIDSSPLTPSRAPIRWMVGNHGPGDAASSPLIGTYEDPSCPRRCRSCSSQLHR
jgi:hypothetical protein